MTISKKSARTLAISYQAFCECRNKGDRLGIRCWGRILIEAQDETGIELQDPDCVRALIELNRETVPIVSFYCMENSPRLQVERVHARGTTQVPYVPVVVPNHRVDIFANARG